MCLRAKDLERRYCYRGIRAGSPVEAIGLELPPKVMQLSVRDIFEPAATNSEDKMARIPYTRESTRFH